MRFHYIVELKPEKVGKPWESGPFSPPSFREVVALVGPGVIFAASLGVIP
jgi:hypothetical protein